MSEKKKIIEVSAARSKEIRGTGYGIPGFLPEITGTSRDIIKKLTEVLRR